MSAEPPDSLPGMLANAVSEHPDRVFLRDNAGELTYCEFATEVSKAGARLAAAGVADGEVVGLVMGTSAEQVAIWYSLACRGLLHVPINPALFGDRLVHVIETAQAGTLVVDGTHLATVLEVLPRVPSVRRVIVRGGAADGPSGPVEFHRYEDLDPHGRGLPIEQVPDSLQVATLLFTSGSTGPSKACALSHRYLARQAQLHAKYLQLRADDVLYTPFPLFHIDGANLTVGAALAAGCTAALGERFSASGFWAEVRRFGATVFNFMGATLTILLRQPPSELDREHRVRLAWGVPMPEWYEQWAPRFGFDLVEVYGSTDAGVPAYDPVDEPHVPGSCGRVVDEYEVITVSPTGERTQPGEPGEIWVRGRTEGLVMSGYHRMPEATRRTLLHPGGWVRTGDRGVLSADGRLSFRGRLSDSIRRRGENISAQEVEQLVEKHDAVLSCAAVGVPSALTEEDVKIYVMVRSGADLDPEELLRHCRTVMPAFMVPRYVQLVDALPRTPTEKVDKPALRLIADSSRTYDAELCPAGPRRRQEES
ncbi:MAG TPA: AMP-binding protein [Amycolatopsis sp.]|nr:AMP-binding protein [Amycolatopsis sp.]